MTVGRFNGRCGKVGRNRRKRRKLIPNGNPGCLTRVPTSIFIIQYALPSLETPKDPGIPNNFPFKDQILAEVAEQRRIEAAEKLRKKEEKKALRAKVKNPDAGSASDENAQDVGDATFDGKEELKGLQVGNDAVGGIGAKQLLHAKTFSRPTSVPETEESDENEVPVLINHGSPNLQAVLDDADVVIEVLDARDPLPCRSSHLEGLVTAKANQHLLLVLNKIDWIQRKYVPDTCPLESVTAWAAYLRSQHPTVLFRSASGFLPSGPESSTKGQRKAKVNAHDGLGVDSVLECLVHWATTKKGEEPLTAAVVGVTNVGKSSLINSLIQSSSLPVYSTESSSRGPTTTDLSQEVLLESAGRQIRLIDTPGLTWEVDKSAEDRDSMRARDILLRSKGRIDRLKDPTSVVASIVTRSHTEDLMLLYSLPAFMRGELDLIGASRILLRDWSTGKFSRYSIPPTTTCTSQAQHSVFEKLYSSDATILEAVLSRKELRKSVGLVKISPGEVDSRNVVLQDHWLKESNSEVDNDEDEKVTGSDGVDDDSDSDDDRQGPVEEDSQVVEEDSQVDDDEVNDGTNDGDEAPLPLSKKQKRKRTNEPLVAPSSKKVAFAPEPKIAKQVRKAASIRSKKLERPPANLVSKSKVKPANAKVRIRDDEAYDFGKFF
ncbi:hypothetical protein C0992_005566 [Termitomyces sp. T32_za158]|nr:hypothetical protein C0992_005566 [Termitomyces sp. T32_za158]